jgi:CRISP-associated protein Cas1
MMIEHLIVDSFGAYIGKYSERLKVTQGGETLAEAPLMHLQSVTINSHGVSISSDALDACCERGVPIHFISQRGRSYASVYAAGLTGTVRTRREQLYAYDDARGAIFAVTLAHAKLDNQIATLKYVAKNRKESAPDVYAALHDAAADIDAYAHKLDRLPELCVDDLRNSIMTTEAHAAKLYWAALRGVIPASYNWHGRETRGAIDPINSLLNYGYGILYGVVERALVLAGLDPYAGFLHADRPGKPSLVLDCIEEFRQVGVDRLVIGLANRNYRIEQMDDGKLSSDTRRDYADKVLKHLDSSIRHQGKRYAMRHVVQMQARHLASFLRADVAEYVPYKASW